MAMLQLANLGDGFCTDHQVHGISEVPAAGLSHDQRNVIGSEYEQSIDTSFE